MIPYLYIFYQTYDKLAFVAVVPVKSFNYFNIYFVFLFTLENDLIEVETWLFSVNFYKIYEITHPELTKSS